ncbi:MAG TPA: hypothetical protein VHW23_39890, partial [Kofleriaceae bacterium]|nr:hypothetical protein [Kofleriaceae bacterium]
RTVRAEPSGDAALSWRAPAGCPDAADLRARIQRRLGAPFAGAVGGVSVDITDRGDGQAPRFEARVDLRDAGSDSDGVSADPRRVVTGERCEDVVDAVAVIIARLAAAHVPPPAGDPPRRELWPAAEAIRDRADEQRIPAPAAASPMGADLRVTGVSAIGAQPGISVGGELAARLRVRSAMLELAVIRWRSTSQALHAEAAGQIDVNLRAAALRLGWSPEAIPLRAWLSGELGTLRGEGIAIAAPTVGALRWMAVGAGFAVAWAIVPRVRLVGMVELAAAMRRARFVLRDGSEVYRSGAVAARTGVGLEIGWP